MFLFRQTLQQLWRDETAFIISAELILLTAILVLGLVVGLTALRDTINSELASTASGFSQINQSYSISGVTGHGASTAGFFFLDQADFGGNTSSTTNQATGGINFIPAQPEM